MTQTLKLTRPKRGAHLISLVPMIDVLLILLVFFMVTSTYLNLDMIPASGPEQPATGRVEATAVPSQTLMIRLGADGSMALGGQNLDLATLMETLTRVLLEAPLTQVLILPSGQAQTQSLISVLDVAAEVGVQRLRVVRLDAQP
ncbi:ExbD/TolR family protein [Arenibacterium sp. LLYu02]|uniref:ExbD/TolR family protein n=1 Tax=Arenibacterium sp. LLYu02 TaxID=3404132 RepID=UPI003B21F4F9